MTKRYAERVDMGDKAHPLPVDLYHDSEVGKTVSYALRSFKTLNALKQAPAIDVGKGIEVYSAKLPQFNEKSRINAGFIHPSPHEEGVYWLVMDERLNDDERLAVAFHEISHLAGGYHSDEKQTQKTAIDSLATLARNYDKLNNPEVSKTLQRDVGVRYDISEMDKTEIGRALKYLMDTSHYFGMNQEDMDKLGVRSSSKKNLEGLLGIVSIFLGIFLLLPLSNFTGNVIGNQSYFSSINFREILGISLVLFSLGVFSYKKILFRRIK
jgi:hypothetical protein|tara:strand:+ start:337 stop:1140 length:804 start_codon:yes stop_codon:yes gene_type:complete